MGRYALRRNEALQNYKLQITNWGEGFMQNAKLIIHHSKEMILSVKELKKRYGKV